MAVTIDPSAHVDVRAKLGDGVQVWHLAQVREDAELGDGCVLGRGSYVGPAVLVGRHVKIQNYALVYDPARLGDGVFVGPGVVLTNDRHPRAVEPDGSPKASLDWEPVGVTVDEGASVGAGSTVVAPVHIGTWAMVGAGSLVTRDVPAFALVVGSPARRVGWVGRTGHRLVRDGGGDGGDEGSGRWLCPRTGSRFVEQDGALVEIDGPASSGGAS